ncbi:ribosomal protein L3 (plastid) [Cryptomonas paramecium]|uniref:Large ribosomal subunit protein uL3c n=1 Tax=Cryptomonas paramaecium TaxID=2898 RepID=D2IS94_9CRYP|nr:ribosomal protein L3 [Cryptomonas paramecium]ACT46786.1 ribosomal protein L3 [Cryptomonas paramecium]BDA98009.1 ribosomal protein L3 [Cryptomonas paramecium]
MCMNFGILGTKVGMTNVFDPSGVAIPGTIVKVGPCIVTQVKTVPKEGYSSIQLGYFSVAKASLSKPELGHLKISNSQAVRYLREFRVDSPDENLLGQEVTVSKFSVGDRVSVAGKSVGKGFSGTVKRHHFTRGPMTHGSKNHREPGSIGMGTTPGRVFPGKRMAGRLGGKKVTIKNLRVVFVSLENNFLVLKGSVPGKKGSLLRILGTKS